MTENKNLNTLAESYNTDKLEHGYIKIYEKYFESIRNENLKILEIGIADGKSLLMWSDYFKNSTVIGIDIHKIDVKEKKLDRNNIKLHQGSQSDNKFINEINHFFCSVFYFIGKIISIKIQPIYSRQANT